MPVAAVIFGGRPMLSCGSRMTRAGSIRGWKMMRLMCSASSVITEARPTSEPVPAVVGTATTGAMPATSTRLQLSPTSSKSHSGRFWPTIRAMALPASSAEPPPKAITPSWPPALKAATPSITLCPVGLPLIAENSPALRPSSRHCSRAWSISDRAARPGSVTSSGALMPRARQACGSSLMRPAPTRIEVG
ncbi:hypothetical protein D3C85_604260 [compost metagenome]